MFENLRSEEKFQKMSDQLKKDALDILRQVEEIEEEELHDHLSSLSE
jgi:hypothetical protein